MRVMPSTRARTHVVWAAVGLFVLTWSVRYMSLVGFPNDHFLYLAPAQQMRAGELPSKDFVDPGTPLMYAVSAVARLVVDAPLLAEALVVSTAFALAAALTVYAAFIASGTLGIAVAVALVQVAMFPRSYHYPKLLLYAAGVLTIWRYSAEPSARRALLVGACIVVAFLFRHDHGIYLTVAALVAAVIARPGWNGAVPRISQMAGIVALLASPYLVFVATVTGLAQHFASGAAYSRSEIGRAIAGLPAFDWSEVLSAQNLLLSLFYIFHLVPIIAIAVLIRRRAWARSDRSDWVLMLPVVVLAIAANMTLLRDPLDARLPDVAVPIGVLGAWLMPQPWRGTGSWFVAGRVLVFVLAGVCLAGANVIGRPAEQLDRAVLLTRPARILGHARSVLAELQMPFHEGQLPSRVSKALIPFMEYVGRCTTPHQRLFIAGDAPEIYVFARRLFAGGQPALRNGFFSTIGDQQRLVSRLRRQDVPLALVLTEGDARLFTLVMAELDAGFQSVREITVEGQGVVDVRVNRRARTDRLDESTGLPCFT
jgi:hypothetical protein